MQKLFKKNEKVKISKCPRVASTPNTVIKSIP